MEEEQGTRRKRESCVFTFDLFALACTHLAQFRAVLFSGEIATSFGFEKVSETFTPPTEKLLFSETGHHVTGEVIIISLLSLVQNQSYTFSIELVGRVKCQNDSF